MSSFSKDVNPQGENAGEAWIPSLDAEEAWVIEADNAKGQGMSPWPFVEEKQYGSSLLRRWCSSCGGGGCTGLG